jgi:hypothetical protein
VYDIALKVTKLEILGANEGRLFHFEGTSDEKAFVLNDICKIAWCRTVRYWLSVGFRARVTLLTTLAS